jgi:sodium transport system permease protein
MNPIVTIFKKEFRDMFRDKRVRSMVLITPMLLIFMLIFLFGFLMDSVGKPSSLKVYVVKGSPVADQFLGSKEMTVIPVDSLAQGKALIKNGTARVVLDFPSRFPTVNDPSEATVNAYFDPKQEMSRPILSYLEKRYSVVNKGLIGAILSAKQITGASAEPVHLVENEITVGSDRGPGQIIVGLLPYLIVIWAFYGGMSIATELVAGEKDKNTLETLLITPASRVQIALGKFFALATLCLIGSVSSFVGLVVLEKFHIHATMAMFPHGLGISGLSMLLIFIALLPTVAMFASILLAISTLAKNPREAQTYLAAVNFIVLMPAMMSQFIGYTEFANATWLYAVPVLNTATIIRQALLGTTNYTGIAIATVVSLTLALIGLAFAVKLFTREQVLTRI